MATISENLQILKDSTDAIKQAIIDKGGVISGDITTWADVISELSGGGSSTEEEITFSGIITWNMMNCTITGSLSSRPANTAAVSLAMVFRNGAGDVVMNDVSISTNIQGISITCNYNEPSLGSEIPALFIAYNSGSETKIIPVRFIQQTGHQGGAD